MRNDREVHKRQSIRLKDYDYAQAGGYFITICAWNRESIFGDIKDGKFFPNHLGEIVVEEWRKSPEIRQEITLDEFTLMPNHFHGIVMINRTGNNNVGANGRSPLHMQSKSIPSFVAGFKSVVTKRINTLRNTPGVPVWQRNYYDHIIRNDEELHQIREYITNNPLTWDEDEENEGAMRNI